nr:unnamed protein product [Callosobruchus analis]
MDFFKRFFGYDKRGDGYSDGEDEPQSENFTRHGFDMYSDPLHIHQYFEQEIDNILRSFGLPGFGNFFGDFSDNPSIDGPPISGQIPASSEGLREQFLKPGYEKPSNKQYEKVDKDLDDRIKSGNLDAILRDDSTEVAPYQKQSSTNFFYGKSKTMSTITHPDGSIETKECVRDNTGNEEVTTCRIFGEKQYCVIKKRDRNGKEEITEKLINMDEKEKEILLEGSPPQNSSPRDIFDRLFN